MSTQNRLLKTSVSMLCLGLLHTSALHAATTNVLQWSFTSTSGPLTVPITDSSGSTPPHPGTDLLHGGEPVYSADIPTNRQHTAGTGSIDFTSVPTAISTTNSLAVGSGQGIITPEQVAAAGVQN